MSNTQASGIDFVKRYTELRKEFNMVDALRKLQIESSSPPQEPSAKAIAEAAKNTCDIPGCKKIAPQNDIFCKDHRY